MLLSGLMLRANQAIRSQQHRKRCATDNKNDQPQKLFRRARRVARSHSLKLCKHSPKAYTDMKKLFGAAVFSGRPGARRHPIKSADEHALRR